MIVPSLDMAVKMGSVHELLQTKGYDVAKREATDALDRQAVDVAFGVLSDEEQRIGLLHAGWAMTSLPHKQTADTLWVRQGGGIKLHLESGTDQDLLPVGLPYGSIARIILMYLQTEAVRRQSRQIELGRSLNQFLTRIGIESGGQQYRMVREQSRRLSMCRLTFFREMAAGTHVTNGSFVRDAILPNRESDQMSLWREEVTLDEGFYQSLIDHPLPVLESAIRMLGSRSLSIDIYVWLAYRLHALSKPTPISWAALYAQFGHGYALMRQFKARFREPLKIALAAYPDARVSVDDKTGLVLYPSASPVRKLIGG